MRILGWPLARRKENPVRHYSGNGARAGAALAKRNYEAAVGGRLYGDWNLSWGDADTELRVNLSRMRNAARDLERNNDYVRRFLAAVTINTVGPRGIVLQARVRKPSGDLDNDTNRLIEAAWAEWGRRGVCTVDGRLSWVDVQRLVARSIARDGEVLIRLITGARARNRFGFALKILEADFLDENLNKDLGNGRRIVMGVELDEDDRPVAYHLWTRHPGVGVVGQVGRYRERVPADEILHPFAVERPGQNRGVPWTHSAVNRLKMLAGYEEAELVAARVAASKMGFYTEEESGAHSNPDAVNEDGDLVMDAEAGTFEKLPPGVDFKAFDPQHPNTAFPEFRKGMLRGAAAGMGVTYNGLANDLEGVNYSSLRQGSLEERDAWRAVQRSMAEGVNDPIRAVWLLWSITTGALPLPMRQIDRFHASEWQPRGWQWVDPEKEVKANVAAMAAGLRSRADVLAEQGRDVADTFEQLKAEQDLAEGLGLKLTMEKDNGKTDGPKDADGE